MNVPPRNRPSFQGPLTSVGTAGTLAGGTVGSTMDAKRPTSVSSADPSLTVAVTLDTALGALTGMLAAVLRPDARGARDRLDRHYETLITCLEEWRDAIPKA